MSGDMSEYILAVTVTQWAGKEKDIKLIFIMGRLNDNASSYETRYTCVTFYLDVTRGRCCQSKVVLFIYFYSMSVSVYND